MSSDPTPSNGPASPPPPPPPLPPAAPQRSARAGPHNPPPVAVRPPTQPKPTGRPAETSAPQVPSGLAPVRRKPIQRWIIAGVLGILLGAAGFVAYRQATTDEAKSPVQASEPTEQRAAIDTCHFRTAGQSVRCGPASFRATPGGDKLFTVPVGQEITLLCRSVASTARNNQQPPTRESDVWLQARVAGGREAWVAAIVVDAWPPRELTVPEC